MCSLGWHLSSHQLTQSLSSPSLPFLFFNPTFCYLSGAGQGDTTSGKPSLVSPDHQDRILSSPSGALREFWDIPAVMSARSWCRMLSPNYAMSSPEDRDSVPSNPHNVKETQRTSWAFTECLSSIPALLLPSTVPVSINCCRCKVPQTRNSLSQSSGSWQPRVGGVSKAGLSRGLLPWLARVCLPAVCSHGLSPSAQTHPWCFFLLIGSPVLLGESPPADIIHCQLLLYRPNLQI